MATSPFFDQHIHRKSEQNLQEDLVIENIQIFGQDVIYIPMENFKIDPILREPKDIIFTNNYVIEAYLPQNGDPEGEQNILSKFGLRSNKTIEVLISKKRFLEVTGKKRPMEGDLVYVGNPHEPENSYMNLLFEINNVTYQSPEWAMGGHYTYRLFCDLYQYSYDRMNTGLKAIDQLDMTGHGATAGDNLERIQALEDATSNTDMKQHMDILKAFNKKNPLGDF